MASRKAFFTLVIFGLMLGLAVIGFSGCGGGGGGGGGTGPVPTSPTTTSPTSSPTTSPTVTPTTTPTTTPTAEYTLTISMEGQGSVSPPSGSVYDAGTAVTLTPNPDQYWVFSTWQGPDGGDVQSNKIVMDSDKSVTALFVRPTYDLTVNITGQGAVNRELVARAAYQYYYGDTVRLTAVPTGQGWVFTGWSGALTGTTNPQEILMDSNKTVNATFQVATSYELDTTWGIGGAVTHVNMVNPFGIARASDGRLFVSDLNGPMFTITSAGVISQWTAVLSNPFGVAVDQYNQIYIADPGTAVVIVYSDPDAYLGGIFVTDEPHGVAVDSDSNIYVADFNVPGAVNEYNSGGTVLNTWTGNGQGVTFSLCNGVYLDGSSNMYVSDFGNHLVHVFDSTGTFVDLVPLYDSANPPLPGPVGIILDSGGYVYVADANKDIIHKVSPTDQIYPIGSGILDAPQNIAMDPAGNLYVTDMANHRVLKLKPVP